MTAPRGLVAAALLLWGWSIGQPALGIVLGVAFEVARMAPRSPKVAARLPPVIHACATAAVVLLGYAVFAQSLPNSLYTWLRWLPLVLLPVPALALIGGGLRIGGREADATHPYAAITLAAAGTGTGAAGWLYTGYAIVVGWALLARLPSGRLVTGAVMFVGAAAIGHAAHTGIWLLQGRVEEWSAELFHDLFAAKADPYRERTRIGDLGRIKLSDRIVMRVEVAGAPSPLLLRESSFERYRNGEWHNARPRAALAPREADRWVLSRGPAGRRLTVRRSFPDGEGLLPLPRGTRDIGNLPAAEVEVFPSGVARVNGTPRFAAFDVAYDDLGERRPPDPRADLDVPATLLPVLERAIEENGLRGAGGAEAIAAVRAFFDRGYAYSLDLGDRARTLSDFLLTDRKGHCEYFASATVLLLRALGVPARYAAGYSAQEWSDLERAFVVRNRHAHAWAEAYVDGRWIEVDTTPARWAELEREAARGFLDPVLDAFSWVFEEMVRAWMAADERALLAALGGLAGAGALAAAAVALSRRWRRGAAGARARPDAIARAWRGVEARLARLGHRRGEGETVRAWVRRLRADPAAAPWAATLQGLAADYYRVRFDPAAPAAEAARFVDAARRWTKASRAADRPTS